MTHEMEVTDDGVEKHEHDPEMVTTLRLSGCEWVLRYLDKEAIARAVRHLAADGHGHHFAVTDEGTSLACSGMAIDCLRKANQLP